MRSKQNSSTVRGTPIVALALVSGLAACSSGESQAQSPPAGAQLFAQQACATCHGDHGQGSMLAPALTDAKSNWTRESLAAYLNDPAGYAAKDPRLSKQGKTYFQAMPTYKMLKPEERSALADHVLSFH